MSTEVLSDTAARSKATACRARHLGSATRRVRDVCGEASTTAELIDGLRAPLNDALGLSGMLLSATDPQTTALGTATIVEHLPAEISVPWMHNEHLEDDFNKFADLHRTGVGPATLHRATQNRPGLSPRHDTINRRLGFGAELRTTFGRNGAAAGDRAGGLPYPPARARRDRGPVARPVPVPGLPAEAGASAPPHVARGCGAGTRSTTPTSPRPRPARCGPVAPRRSGSPGWRRTGRICVPPWPGSRDTGDTDRLIRIAGRCGGSGGSAASWTRARPGSRPLRSWPACATGSSTAPGWRSAPRPTDEAYAEGAGTPSDYAMGWTAAFLAAG